MGSVDPREVNVENAWKLGRQDASTDLATLPFLIKLRLTSWLLSLRTGKSRCLIHSKRTPRPRPLAICLMAMGLSAAPMTDCDGYDDEDGDECEPGQNCDKNELAHGQVEVAQMAVDFEDAAGEELAESEGGSDEAMGGAGKVAYADAGAPPRELPAFISDWPGSSGERFYISKAVSLVSKNSGELLKKCACWSWRRARRSKCCSWYSSPRCRRGPTSGGPRPLHFS